MKKVIIASHHQFAFGVTKALRFFGYKGDIQTICAYMNDGYSLEVELNRAFEDINSDDEVLILTDLLQGSVCQAFVPYIGNHVFLVAGVNMPLVVELCLTSKPLTVEFVERSIDLARQSMRLVNTMELEDNEDDE